MGLVHTLSKKDFCDDHLQYRWWTQLVFTPCSSLHCVFVTPVYKCVFVLAWLLVVSKTQRVCVGVGVAHLCGSVTLYGDRRRLCSSGQLSCLCLVLRLKHPHVPKRKCWCSLFFCWTVQQFSKFMTKWRTETSAWRCKVSMRRCLPSEWSCTGSACFIAAIGSHTVCLSSCCHSAHHPRFCTDSHALTHTHTHTCSLLRDCDSTLSNSSVL